MDFFNNLAVIFVLIASSAFFSCAEIALASARKIRLQQLVEAGNQKDIGMKAVAFATLNRLKHSAFPDTICEAVHQKIANVCQFSWTCFKKRKIQDYYAYYRSKRMAELVMMNYGYMYDITKGATFFHRNDVWPGWANPKKRTIIIGRHLFYTL